MTHYVGIVDGSGAVWGVTIPDMPGCHGGGATIEEAIQDAISAMREWAADREADGLDVPMPRPLPEVLSAVERLTQDVPFTTTLLPLLRERGKPVKANISVDAALLAEIDAAAERRGMTRSAFLVAAARAMIERDAA